MLSVWDSYNFNEVVSTSPLLVEENPVFDVEGKRTDCKSSLVHLSSRGAPWIVGSGLANFGLPIGLTFV